MEYIMHSTFGKKISALLYWFNGDARHNQILGQLILLLYGLLFLSWSVDLAAYMVLIGGCIMTQGIGITLTNKDFSGLKSAFISSLSLCLMFKADSLAIFLLAAVLSIASKYVIRYKGKHIFNPTNFGIIATILLTGQGWISPGLWGSSMVVLVLVALCGFSILSKVRRIDAALSFLLIFSGLHFIRMVLYLGWELEVFFHHLSSGTLLLFTFFMMTDPVTTPRSRKGRIIWAALIGVVSFVVSNFFYVHTAPIWVLLVCTPLTIWFNKIFKGKPFEW